jgi:spore coat polysaccharide biosynthesis predicted glycosyltransferase SpsG
LVAVVDHQETISAAFARYGSATYAGRLGQIDPAAVVVEVARLLRDAPALEAMAAAGRSIVDGKGAQRAVARLLTAAS